MIITRTEAYSIGRLNFRELARWVLTSSKRQEIKKIKKLLQALPADAKVLDVGCGKGLLMRRLSGRVFGVDQNEESVTYCINLGLNVRLVRDGIIPFNDGDFDVVICSHVLEHLQVEDTKALLSEINRVVKHGGYIVIVCPLPSVTFYDEPTHIKPYTLGAITSLTTSYDKKGPYSSPSSESIGDWLLVKCQFRYPSLINSMPWQIVRYSQGGSSVKGLFSLNVLFWGIFNLLAVVGVRKYWKPDAYIGLWKKQTTI